MISRQVLAANALEWTGLRWLSTRVTAWRGVLCLAYHRIGYAESWPFDRGLWSATPEGFSCQVGYIKKHCDIIVPDELDEAVKSRRGRYALITFDDGYRDNYETAFPILRTHGVKGTFFVTTGFIDQPRLSWWDELAWMVRTSRRRAVRASRWVPKPVALDQPDREQAIRALLRCYKNLPGRETNAYMDWLAEETGSGRHDGSRVSDFWMSWDMLREMSAAGMAIGGHTVNHPVLARLPAEIQQAEISGCVRRIEAELGRQVTTFSYPVGGLDAFNEETRACLIAAGIKTAFSYYGGIRSFDSWDRLDIRRIAIEMDTSPGFFRSSVALPSLFHAEDRVC